MKLQLDNMIFGTKIRLHPATGLHGSKGDLSPFIMGESRELWIPDGTFPWIKVWDYGEWITVLVSPSDKPQDIQEANFIQIYNDTPDLIFIHENSIHGGCVAVNIAIPKLATRTISIPNGTYPEVAFTKKDGRALVITVIPKDDIGNPT